MPPRLHRLEDPTGEPALEDLHEALAVLAEGRLVALPTETVYGLAARADSAEALERLAAIKGRPSDIAWTWHVGSLEALARYPHAGAHVHRLAERYWPGPLTLVLPGVPRGLELAARGGWTGVRFTAEPFALALCKRADFPIVMTSANRHGQPPAVCVDDLAQLDPALLDLVIDGGRTRLQEASTILRVGRGRFELLREGLHDLEALRRTSGRRLGFACTGNTCRSPMAEALARHLLAERLECEPARLGDMGFELRSMGVFASCGARASAHAVEVLAERGVDLAGHRSSPALPEVVAELDEVLCMTHAHLEALAMLLPPGKDGHLRLLDPEERDVPDPIGGTLADYRRCADHIEASLRAHLDRWA
ncbi:MAG: threonylcarbamoyl-AMP synthase [Planctomycetes bacterium]|nr:threonylcarbamoyl-AMP synthase [Planctomycetota bacterium]